MVGITENLPFIEKKKSNIILQDAFENTFMFYERGGKKEKSCE